MLGTGVRARYIGSGAILPVVCRRGLTVLRSVCCAAAMLSCVSACGGRQEMERSDQDSWLAGASPEELVHELSRAKPRTSGLIRLRSELRRRGRSSVSSLRDALPSSSGEVRYEILSLLSTEATRSDLADLEPYLADALRDPDPYTRAKAAYIVGYARVRSDRVVAALFDHLGDEGFPASFSAADALGELGNSTQVRLLDVLEDDGETPNRRVAAGWGLVQNVKELDAQSVQRLREVLDRVGGSSKDMLLVEMGKYLRSFLD